MIPADAAIPRLRRDLTVSAVLKGALVFAALLGLVLPNVVGLPGGVFVLLALAWIGADAAENLLINEMLLRGPVALDRALVEWSSLFTRLKYVLLAVCGVALFGLWKQQRGR